MSSIPESSLPLLEGLDVVIIDALRPHPSSTHHSRSLRWWKRIDHASWLALSHEVDMSDGEDFPPT